MEFKTNAGVSATAQQFDVPTVVEHVAAYVELKHRIAALEEEATEHRRVVAETLPAAAPKTYWEFPGVGKVTVVSGRVTVNLSRKALAAMGVSEEQLDAATERTEGRPSLRIEGEEDGE